MSIYLNSIEVKEPPSHTQVAIRCEQCSKREVCSYQSDYRKVATLIQNVLGDPQFDREIVFCDCGFTGYEFDDVSIFPKTYEIVPKKDSEEITANFLNTRFSSKDTVKLLVKIEDYYVLFILTYDEAFSKYTVKSGRELIYGISYELTDAALETLQEPLATWRAGIIEKEEEAAKEETDIINTTPFSAILNCKYFEPIRKQGTKNPNDFTNHNCGEGYYHIATYHKENSKVKEACNCSDKPTIGFYPWFIPVPPLCAPKKKPKRRDDQ